MTGSLPVTLYGVHLGDIRTHHHSGVAFQATTEALDNFGVGSPVLSVSMPLRLREFTHSAGPFFGGLLPEGEALERLAVLAGTDPSDVVGLLAYAGRDVAGAVAIGRPSDHPPRYVPLDDEGIAQRLHDAGRYPLGEVGGGTSLPGYQRKIALGRFDGVYYAREGAAASTHILKPARAPEYESAIASEAYVLELAHRSGLATYDSELRRFGDILALVIERYDRRVVGNASDHVIRIHQEDGAQALGLGRGLFDRFEWHEPAASLAALAERLDRDRVLGVEGAASDQERLLSYVTFNVAIGNTDAHAKNFSLLHPDDGSVSLAPLYDVGPHALDPDGSQRLSMAINGRTLQPDVCRDDLVAEAESWGVTARTARAVIDATLERLLAAVDEAPSRRPIPTTFRTMCATRRSTSWRAAPPA